LPSSIPTPPWRREEHLHHICGQQHPLIVCVDPVVSVWSYGRPTNLG
jgi:hypothetical protein